MKKERSSPVETKEGPWVIKFKNNRALLPFYMALGEKPIAYRLMGSILNWVLPAHPQIALRRYPEAYRAFLELQDSGRARALALVPFEGGPNIPSIEEARRRLKQLPKKWQEEREFQDMLNAARKQKVRAAGGSHGS